MLSIVQFPSPELSGYDSYSCEIIGPTAKSNPWLGSSWHRLEVCFKVWQLQLDTLSPEFTAVGDKHFLEGIIFSIPQLPFNSRTLPSWIPCLSQILIHLYSSFIYQSSIFIRIHLYSANRVLVMIKRTFTVRDKSIVLQLYKSLNRPHLEYSVQAWRPQFCKDIDHWKVYKEEQLN